MILIAANMLCVSFGAYKPLMRAMGACTGCLLFIANFALVIVTAVYRFRPSGQLCALSEQPTNYTSSNDFDDDWTYKKDAGMIFGLWISQFATMLLCCDYAVSPTKIEKVAR